MFVLERQQWVPSPIDQTFDFFGRAENLERLTPPWLGFSILTPVPIAMAPGTIIDYRIKLGGLPIRWRTLIAEWKAGVGFMDTQVRGPYKMWEHTHSFQEMGGGTLIIDRVRYALPLGVLGRAVHSLIVRGTLARIFDHRYHMIVNSLGAPTLEGVQSTTTATSDNPRLS